MNMKLNISHIKKTLYVGALGEDFAKFCLDTANKAIEIALAEQEPTCQIKNLDNGVTETMTREKAKKLQDELGHTVEWYGSGLSKELTNPFYFTNGAIYTYKLKANLVKLDGKLMTREAAVAKWESKKETCDVWYTSDSPPMGKWELERNFSGKYAHNWNSSEQVKGAEYQLRVKPLKQVSWKNVPVGVAVQHNDLLLPREKEILTFIGVDKDGPDTWLWAYSKNSTPDMYKFVNFELAPASEQPWLVYIQGETDLDALEGLEIELLISTNWEKSPNTEHVASFKQKAGLRNQSTKAFRIAGLAKGYELK
jgi:hypothetical protein